MLSKSTKNLSQTKKAIGAREKRASDKERRRHDIFICDYIFTKYMSIYEEADTAYQELLLRHPSKLDLTKTYHYLKWKKETIRNSQVSVPQPAVEVENGDGEASVPQPAVKVENGDGEASVPQPAVEVENGDGEASVPQPAVEVENGDGEASVPQPVVEVEIENGKAQMTDSGESTLDEMERIINGIIREFEQDDEIMKYLPQIEQNELDEVFW